MRICILRNTLREVVLSSPAGEQGAIRWILEADSASREIERWSNEMNARFQVLQCSDGDFAGRKRDLEMLLAGRSELIGVLGLARKLISQRISPSREAYASSYSDLVGTLRSFDRQLRIMVETYEEIPRAIDEALGDAADNVVNPEKVVIELHRLMRTSVFAEYSPLRANPNLWDAFVQQQDEFISFYKSAYSALEIYAEVLQAYSLRRLTEEKPSKHGGLEKICQDKSVQVRERNSCIEAIGYLYGKFSAMLMVL
jgi:hypothetical protein